MIFRYYLCDFLKQLIQLFDAILPRPDDQIFDLNKQTQRIRKTVIRAYSRQWGHECVFWGHILEKGHFFRKGHFFPLSRCHF